MAHSTALFGDTQTPVYGSEADPNYKKSGYSEFNEENTGYAKSYPKYVKKPTSLFQKDASVRVYGAYGPVVWIQPASSGVSWIDASRNRRKIKAALAVLMGLVLFLFGILAINTFMKKYLQSN